MRIEYLGFTLVCGRKKRLIYSFIRSSELGLVISIIYIDQIKSFPFVIFIFLIIQKII